MYLRYHSQIEHSQVKDLYRAFKGDCPTGIIDETKFKEVLFHFIVSLMVALISISSLPLKAKTTISEIKMTQNNVHIVPTTKIWGWGLGNLRPMTRHMTYKKVKIIEIVLYYFSLPRYISRCFHWGSRPNMHTWSSNPLTERTKVTRSRWLLHIIITVA